MGKNGGLLAGETMSDLHRKKCLPCVGVNFPLKKEELRTFFSQLAEGWDLKAQHHLEKVFLFKDFEKALAFTNVIGKIAEQEGHHPEICLSYGKVKVLIWTHAINGLSENDFILADKIETEFVSHQG